MKQSLIFVQDPNALKNWLEATDSQEVKVLYDLHELEKRFIAQSCILLVQLSEHATVHDIGHLVKHGFDVLVFSNLPSNEEGLALFKNGIKGYLNTFSTPDRIKQAMTTIMTGNVWLGQSIMTAMIQSVGSAVTVNDDWRTLLTEREFEVVKLVLESLPNRAIAERLNITERTVKSHLHNTFEKLNVKDRLALALKVKNWQSLSA
ncbi:response regulator transcription factor [Thiomicrorhabdus aquaedulcis]|uniref:response regulator transcription factor n=1 Tax=Thiomicrorhabdus aquaedulcis TaxID=2211106 RepID=UPI000FD98082|nr:response regulator transcription factor [Thiomicrorhabdus aquaedulcis]